jgi:hypothetical protein
VELAYFGARLIHIFILLDSRGFNGLRRNGAVEP